MSIEVEVGLENFDKVPLLEKPKPKRLAEGWANPKWRWAAALGGTLVLAAATGLFLHFHARESTDDAQVDGHLAPISAKISGNVVEVLVDDNQPVKAGQVLVRIDPRDYQAKVDQERAAVAMAESQAQGAHVGVPLTRETTASGNSNAEAQLATAEADFARASLAYDQARTADLAYAHAELEKQHATFELAKSDLARMIPLAQKEEISKQQLDSFAANARVAESQLKADEQRLAQAERSVEISKAAMLAAGARVAQAKAALDDARANFKETQLAKVHAGQRAEIRVDTYGKTFTGHVDSIAGATGARLSLLPPENATGNFVKVVQRIPVKIVLDPVPQDKAVLRPGMNVDATIITQ